MQEIFPLPLNSGTIQLTDAGYWRPSNRNIHRIHDAGEDDQWGVVPDPEGVVAVTQEQRLASLQIRERRSNFLSQESDTLLEDYLRRIPQEIKLLRESRGHRFAMQLDGTQADDETKTKNDSEPFVLQGKAPFYDPQLDRGIELLRAGRTP